MKVEVESSSTKRLSKEQAEKILKDNLKQIKKAIKKKIAIYKPLVFKTAYLGLIDRIKQDEYRLLRKMPEGGVMETYLNNLIKNYLIENAYYALSERYIHQRIMNKLGNPDPNDIRFLETVDFIIERIEKDNLKELKIFKEESSFKTFLSTIITRRFYDFWRKHYKKEGELEKYSTDFDDFFNRPVDDPLNTLINLEDEELKNKAEKILRQLMENLDYKEKLAIKLKYEKDMKMSKIAETFGQTRYKTEKFIKQLENKISKEILSRIKNKGGNNEAPGR